MNPLSDYDRAPIRGPLARALVHLLRRVEFRGKFQLRRFVSVPHTGQTVVRAPGGARLRLDMQEQLERDYYFGLLDQFELGISHRLLRAGGDAIDVGAHIGLWAITAAQALRGQGRVLALEPYPLSYARLLENVRLNGCENVIALQAAASEKPGRAELSVLDEEGVVWSTLRPDPPVPAIRGIEVETTTVDEQVARLGLRPTFVKMDVEAWEPAVIRGMPKTLDLRPVVFSEVWPSTYEEIGGEFERREYVVLRLVHNRLEPGLPSGYWNAFFIPKERRGEIPERFLRR